MQLVQTVTVGSGGAASMEFASIPADATDLFLVVSARQNTTDQIAFLAINNSTANFTSRALLGDGSAVYSESRTDSASGYNVNWSTTTANTFSNFSIYFPNYISSANKSFSVDYVTENNATNSNQGITAGLWSNTSAISSLKINASAGATFVQNSTASLYKITKA